MSWRKHDNGRRNLIPRHTAPPVGGVWFIHHAAHLDGRAQRRDHFLRRSRRNDDALPVTDFDLVAELSNRCQVGYPASRRGAAVASVRSFSRLHIRAIGAGDANPKSTSPVRTAAVAGADPLYGMWISSMWAARLISSPARCDVVPLPGEENLSSPKGAFASVTRSATDRADDDVRTTAACSSKRLKLLARDRARYRRARGRADRAR